MNPTIEQIAGQTLARIDPQRKYLAECGLSDDTWTVTIVDVNEATCDAIVQTERGTYGVFISDKVSKCTCKDHENRGVICKHCAAACYYVLGSTTPEAKETFHCGEKVQLRGLPHLTGTVRCVSEQISVAFPPMGHKLAFTQAYNRVELERARP